MCSIPEGRAAGGLFPSRVSFCLWFSINQISKSQLFQGLLCHQLPTRREENEEHCLTGLCFHSHPAQPVSGGLPAARDTGASGSPSAPSSSRLIDACASGPQRDSRWQPVHRAPHAQGAARTQRKWADHREAPQGHNRSRRLTSRSL